MYEGAQIIYKTTTLSYRGYPGYVDKVLSPLEIGIWGSNFPLSYSSSCDVTTGEELVDLIRNRQDFPFLTGYDTISSVLDGDMEFYK